MARLVPLPTALREDFTERPNEPFMDYLARTDKALAALDPDRLMRFPVADGSAIYYVVKDSPLTLAHLPVGDAYAISRAHLRGLRTADLHQQRAFETWWRTRTK